MTLIEEILNKVQFREVEGKEEVVLDRADWNKLVVILEQLELKTNDEGDLIENAAIEEITLTPEEEASERRWDALFDDPRSEQLLEELSQKALADYRAGRTQELDPDEL